ncbi:MAG: hypothetical protein HYX63_07225 [Gammaproteobacteria bacterium]|nr:hypothetical protein [Gammaproteobacteria bacterium]
MNTPDQLQQRSRLRRRLLTAQSMPNAADAQDLVEQTAARQRDPGYLLALRIRSLERAVEEATYEIADLRRDYKARRAAPSARHRRETPAASLDPKRVTLRIQDHRTRGFYRPDGDAWIGVTGQTPRNKDVS